MTQRQLEKYRKLLRGLADRSGGTAAAIEEEVRVPTGGQADGGLSNAPMHLGDLVTDLFNQELNTTLLENEAYLRDEALEAVGRIDRGEFGRCEECGGAIPAERLDAIPYARTCVPCAGGRPAGPRANVNDGRQQTRRGGDPLGAGGRGDVHAAGTPGGGTAVGGLAGTNLGEGDPADEDLEAAMGSGNFDAALEADDDGTPYAGPSGGAVGGTPAGKRATGGKAPPKS